MERNNGKHYLLRSEKRLLDRRNVSTAAMRLVLTRLLGSSLPWSITVQLKINPRPFIESCSSFLAAVYKVHDRKKCSVVSTSPQQHLVDSEMCKQFKCTRSSLHPIRRRARIMLVVLQNGSLVNCFQIFIQIVPEYCRVREERRFKSFGSAGESIHEVRVS